MKLPRFDGHLIVHREGVRDAYTQAAVPGAIPSTNRRTGASPANWVIGQLADRFAIEQHRARDLWHLVSRLYRKVASHTLCVLINQQLGRPLLQLDGLASI